MKRKGLLRLVIGIILLISIIAGFENFAMKDANGQKDTPNTSWLMGEVVSLSPRMEPVYIGIAVDEENTDYYFTIDEDVNLVHIRDIRLLNVGDTVEVTYQILEKEKKDGKKRREQRVKKIRFIRPAEK